MSRRSWGMAAGSAAGIAVLVLCVLLIASYMHEVLSTLSPYRQLHRDRPFYIAESIDKIGGVAICAIAVWLVGRKGLRATSRELGLSAPVVPAAVFALIVSLPMLMGFALTRSLSPHLEVFPLLFMTVLSPLAEEIEFRGFGVRYLQRATGWKFWTAVWPSALLFGYGHVDQGESLQEMAALFFLIAAGGVVFAWLVYRWQNLWVAITLHVCMNLWWELFSVARNAIGGWFPFALQILTLLLAIAGTLYWKRRTGQEAKLL
jgi:membrane protease YdiL (CAAX protease family)